MKIVLSTHRLSMFVIVSNIGEVLTTLTIDRIGETGVIR